MPDPMPWINFNVLIIFGFSLVALIILGMFVLIGMKIMRGSGSRRRKMEEADESRLIQEIYRGLARMEERVEALETLLFDRGKERGSHEP